MTPMKSGMLILAALLGALLPEQALASGGRRTQRQRAAAESASRSAREALVEELKTEKDPSAKAELYYRMALSYEQEDRLVDAHHAAALAAHYKPGSEPIETLRGRLASKLGLFDRLPAEEIAGRPGEPVWETTLEKLSGEKRYSFLSTSLERSGQDLTRARILREMALMYEEIRDEEEAEKLLGRAAGLDPGNAGLRAELDRIGSGKRAGKTLAQPLRSRLRGLGLALSLEAGYEYDTNVILEEADPFVPTNKADGAVFSGLTLDKKWRNSPKSGGWRLSNNSSLRVKDSRYSRYDGLDIQSKGLDHTLAAERRGGSGFFSSHLRAGLSDFDNAGEDLFWNWEISPGIFFLRSGRGVMWSAVGNFRRDFYSSPLRSGQEGDGRQLRISAMRFLGKDGSNGFSAGLELRRENPRAAHLRYLATGLCLDARFPLPLVTAELSPGMYFGRRDYEAPQKAGEPEREDDELRLSLGVSRKFLVYQELGVRTEFTDNRSSDEDNRYRKTRHTLRYSIRF